MAEPSDEAIRSKLKEMLKVADIAVTTERQLRGELEEHFGCGMKSRKPIIKEVVEAFLSEQVPDDEDDGDAAGGGKRKRGIGGLQSLSPELLEFMQLSPDDDVTRNEVVRKLWEYIKSNDLQDPNNKRNILPDPALSKLFDFPLNILTINKQLSKHCKSRSKVAATSKEKVAKPKAKKAKTGDDGAPKKLSGFAVPQLLSDELAAVVGKTAASRGEVTKLLWSYIKEKGLQNPDNKKQILVKNDQALYKVFEVDTVEGFGMSKYIGKHLKGPAAQDQT